MSCRSPWSRRKALGAVLLGALSPAAWTQSAPDWPLRAQARFRVFGLHVYDARLYAPQALDPHRWHEQAFALELEYARELKGERIAERSLEEMQRQGELPAAQAQAWLAALRATIPDVQVGDRLRGVHEPERGARFWFNGRPRGEPLAVDFSQRFFGIWLHPATSAAGLRRSLLGL